jgi:hypothetical protein
MRQPDITHKGTQEKILRANNFVKWSAWTLCLALCLSLAGQTFAQTNPKSQTPTATTTSGIGSMPRLGVQSFFISEDVMMQALKESGAPLVRVEQSWVGIEPVNTDPAHYNWTYTDGLFSRMSENKLSPIVTIQGCPLWACVRDNGPMYDDKYAEFAQFMGAMAGRYSQAPYNVHYWEFWNEPDAAGGPGNQWGWGNHPDKYATMLSWVYPAIKAQDPQSVVILGGIAYDNFFTQGGPFNPDFLPGVLDAGGAQHLDAIAFHYYVNNAHGWTNIGLKTTAVRDLMIEHGANLPIICTEAGLTSSTLFGSSDQKQARSVVHMNVQGAASGLHALTWYVDRDTTVADPNWEIFAHSGLLRINYSRKPAYSAMQTLAQEVGSGQFLRALNADDGVTGTLEGYRFKRDGRSGHVSVVWNNADATTTLTIPAAQALDLIRAVGLYGATVQPQPGAGGALTLSVGADPVYLEWGALFDDVPGSSWMYPYVEYLAYRGIVGGYSDNTFRPGNPATRGQFAKMIVLGMGWTLVTPAQPHFADVPTSHPFYPYIETAFSQGVISGYPCGAASEPCPGTYFRPGNDVTRGQIAKMIVLGRGWQVQDPATATFTDVPKGSTFFTFVETAFAHGIVGGYNDNTFRAGNNATRAQLSKMLSLALQQ